MQTILRNIAIHALSLFLLTQVLSGGVIVYGGFGSYLFAAIILTVLFAIVKPILSIFTFPLHIATFGLSSLLVNAVLLYLLTVFDPNVAIRAFTFSGFALQGFIIPKISFNLFFAFFAAACIMSCIRFGIEWLID